MATNHIGNVLTMFQPAKQIVADTIEPETVQNKKVVAEMAGTYEQTKTSNTAGKLVFTPITSKTSVEHGAAKVEEDDYTLTKGGKVLRLVSGGDATNFYRQPLADK